jgi:hypothetical protein
MQYLLLLHGNSGYVNAPQCYVIRTLSLLFLCIALVAEECKYNSPEWYMDLCVLSALLEILRFSCGNNILL